MESGPLANALHARRLTSPYFFYVPPDTVQGDDTVAKKTDEVIDKKGESMADWGRRTAVTLALTFLTSSQGLLIAASKSKHVKYDYSVTSANCTVREISRRLCETPRLRRKAWGKTKSQRQLQCTVWSLGR